MSESMTTGRLAVDNDPLLAGLLASAPPRFSPEQAQGLLRDHWGICGTALEIACERDQNFRITTEKGQDFILKVSNAVEDPLSTDFQTAALRWVEKVDPDLPLPRVVAALDGAFTQRLMLPSGQSNVVRVLSWLDGTPLHHVPMTLQMQAGIGTMTARLGLALQEFDHPGARHDLLWDIRHLSRLRPLTETLGGDAIAIAAMRELDHFETHVAPALKGLRRQVIHNDMNHHNILINESEKERITGVLDFGDMVNTYLAIDVAVATSYLASEDNPLEAISRLVAAYHAVLPLKREEIVLLRDLTVARLVASITITSWRAARYPENATYILRNNGPARIAIKRFASLATQSVNRALLSACDME
jgi:hydroxylysine kinase